MEKNEGLLDQLKQRLRQRYQENIDIKRLFYQDYPLSLNDCYIHLGITQKQELESLKKQEDRTNTQSTNFDQRLMYLRGFESGVKIKETIEVAQIATVYIPLQKRILIEGPAGSGKTTLCRYIAYQWALGEESKEPWVKKYDWLFWIPLRELIAISNNSQADLVTILHQVCFRFNATTNLLRKKDNEELFLEHLVRYPQRVLYLLDGYDELDLQNPIIHTLWNELQSNEQIILTTRPGRPITFNPPFKLQLAVLGLSDEQIKNYCTNFFTQAPIKSLDMAKACYEFIKASPNLWSLAHSPINLEMLCSLWDQKALDSKTDINVTDLYQLIFKKLLQRYVKREQPNIFWKNKAAKRKCQAHIEFVEYLAFLAMQREEVFIQDDELINEALKQVIKKRDIDKTFLDQVQALGLLNFYSDAQQAEFAHLTFQEFFAARYIKKQLLTFVQSKILNLEAFKKLLQFIHDKKHEVFYEVMWWFVTGLLAQKPEKPFLIDIKPKEEFLETVSRNQLKLQALQLWVDCVLQPPRHSKNELADVCLLIRCLDEAKFPNIMQKPAIIALFLRWLSFYIEDFKDIEKLKEEKLRFEMEYIIKCLQNSSPYLFRQYCIRKYVQELIEDENFRVLEKIAEIKIWPTLKRAWPESTQNNNEKSLNILLLPLLTSGWEKMRVEAGKALEMMNEKELFILGLRMQQFTLDMEPELESQYPKMQEATITALNVINSAASENDQLQLLSLLISEEESLQILGIGVIKILGLNVSAKIQSELLSLLTSKNPNIQKLTLEAVSAIGQNTILEIQLGLWSLLESEDEDTRKAVVEIIGRMFRTSAKKQQLKLLPLITSDNQVIQGSAFEIITAMGQDTTEEFQLSLLPLLVNENENIKFSAMVAIAMIGQAATSKLQQELLALLLSENEKIHKIVYAILEFSENKIATSEFQLKLRLLLKSENKLTQLAAIRAVHAIGEETINDLQLELLPLITSEIQEIQAKAILTLRSIKTSHEFQLKLLPLLASKNQSLQKVAVKAVSLIGQRTVSELQLGLLLLLKNLSNGDEIIQLAVVRAVSSVGRSAIKELQMGLLLLLTSKNESIQLAAIDAVSSVGKSSIKELQIGLLPLLASKNKAIQLAILNTVKSIAEAVIIDLQLGLLPILQSKNEVIQNAVIDIVTAIGRAGIPALQIGLLQLIAININVDVHRRIIATVEKVIQVNSKELQLELLSLLTSENLSLQKCTMCLIKKIAQAANLEFKLGYFPLMGSENIQSRVVIIPELQSGFLPLLTSENEQSRAMAIEAIKVFGKASIEELQLGLLPLLTSKNEAIQIPAIEAVINIGKTVIKELQLALLPLLLSESLNILTLTLKAIEAIGQSAIQELQLSLTQLLICNDQNIQTLALKAVKAIGQSSIKELQLSLMQLLICNDRNIQTLTLEVVEAIGRSVVEELQLKLLILLESEDKEIQIAPKWKIIDAVKAIGEATTNKFQLNLLSLLKSSNQHKQEMAIDIMERLYQAQPNLQNALADLLASEDEKLQFKAIKALNAMHGLSFWLKSFEKFHPEVSPYIQMALVPLLSSKNSRLKAEVFEVVAAIGPTIHPELLKALMALLICEDVSLQYSALKVICKLDLKSTLNSNIEKLKLFVETNDLIATNVAIFLAIIEKNITYLKKPFKINTLQLPPSQIFDWAEEKIKQLVPLCGEMQKPILQSTEVQHVLTADYWTLALVRKKDHQHVFLVLEGVQDAIHFAKKIELVLPNSSGSSFINPNYAEIQVEDITEPEDYLRLKNLSENCECQIYSITAEIGNQLIGNAKVDQEAKIYYNYLGDGRAYSFSFFNKERHNCLSWCLKQLQELGIPLKRHWLDFICVIPEKYLPSQTKKVSHSRCVFL